MPKSKKSKNSSKLALLKRHRLLTVLAIVLLLGGITYAALRDGSKKPPATSSSSKQGTSTTSGIDLSPATNQDQQNSDSHKDAIVQQKQSSVPSSSSNGQVTPVITYAHQDRINAYIPGVFEDGGTCTATFTQGSSSFSKVTTGFSDATHTTCPPFDNLSFPSSGEWTVTVNYSSANYHGDASTKFTVH